MKLSLKNCKAKSLPRSRKLWNWTYDDKVMLRTRKAGRRRRRRWEEEKARAEHLGRERKKAKK